MYIWTRNPLPDTTSDQFLKHILHAHNVYRSRHQNTEPLVLDQTVIAYARSRCQTISQYNGLSYGHQGLQVGVYGENLYWKGGGGGGGGNSAANSNEAVNSWYDEIKFYNWANPGFSMQTGHFTQLVWVGTSKLGCAQCSSSTEQYIVCNYQIPGNMMGQFPDNVRPQSESATNETTLLDTTTTTTRISQFFTNTWSSLRNRWLSSSSWSLPSIIPQSLADIQANVKQLRYQLTNASAADTVSALMTQLLSMTGQLNQLLRQRADSDQLVVSRLYADLIGNTRNGTNETTAEQLRNAFTEATKTMAENYSGLANNSLQMASDLTDKTNRLFRKAMSRAGNDTNQAVVAVNTAIDAIIRNQTLVLPVSGQQIVASLAISAQRLSQLLRGLYNNNSTDSSEIGVQFRETARQSLETLAANMNELGSKLQVLDTKTGDSYVVNSDDNTEDNEIDVISSAGKRLTKESEELMKQIYELRNR
ncbi:uncharacterized protein LOC128956389 [Oppia nitens]|uniref:uncharacterized protein LOC128956389 n=1 Tax=Oppia nitens TaxID=1686743 RepID=UPI0023DBB7B3|nr:uncharacterized protein LOC128956389 [Oppia nitens]